MDGSQKLPQRLLETVRTRLAAGQPTPHLALAIAGWLRYVGGIRKSRRLQPRSAKPEARDLSIGVKARIGQQRCDAAGR
jgi:mannitol-1-phosphate/altronate dehydrogenase